MTPTQQLDPALSGGVLRNTTQELFGPQAQSPGQSPEESKANQITAPNPPEDSDLVEPIEQFRHLMAALYGSDFPLIAAFDQLTAKNPEYGMMGQMPPLEAMVAETNPTEWSSWVRGRWNYHAPAVQMHLYLVARNRLFRASQQWVSSRGSGPWTTPNRNPEQARVVHNLIAPALDQRIQTITDQRPSFQVNPSAMSPDEKRKAEGRQQALEFQYDEQQMEAMTREACYWAGTDGVAFWVTRWDRDAGPWDQRMGNVPDQQKPLGDLRTKVYRCEQVRVSANATHTEAPYYAIVRDVIPETESAYLYGASGVQPGTSNDGENSDDSDSSGSIGDGILPNWVFQQTVVGEGFRLTNVKTVERFHMFVDKHPDVLPNGLELVILGNTVVWGPDGLLFGCIPVTPVRDGSTDPSYFPRPIMEQWIPPQMRINAALSLWVNNVRVNAGGTFAAKPDAVSRETFIGAGRSLLEVECPGPIQDALLPIQGFSLGQDVKDLIAFDVKAFEDMSGYNDVSRGAVSNETATAVAAANENLQRIFAPPVYAAAKAMTQWAEINIAGMAWGYDVPRDVGMIGSDRPDLARSLSKQDFDGPSTVLVDAEKLLPMPKVYRLQIMDNWLDRGLVNAQQYMRNVKFGSFKNLSTPDEDQEARAKRVSDAIRMGQEIPPPVLPNDPSYQQVSAMPLAMRWTDNEAIFQDVLEREITLQDDLPPEIVAEAQARHAAYAQQAAMKAGTLAPQGAGQAGAAPMTDNSEPPAGPGGGEPSQPDQPGQSPAGIQSQPSPDQGNAPAELGAMSTPMAA